MLLTEEYSYTGLPGKLDLHSQIFVRAVYFLSKYPQCTVVFDGYRNSTKDMAHKVRSKNLSCSNITVELSTCLTVKKAQFLTFLVTPETSKDSSTSSLSILFGRVSAALTHNLMRMCLFAELLSSYCRTSVTSQLLEMTLYFGDSYRYD